MTACNEGRPYCTEPSFVTRRHSPANSGLTVGNLETTMKPFRSIRWKITFAYLLVLASIAVLGIYLSRWTEDYYVSSLRGELLRECRFVGKLAEPLAASGPRAVDPLAKQAGTELGRRVTIIDVNGRVLGDSETDYATMQPHNNRPEVRQALASGSGWAIRYSDTLHIRMLYVAVRVGGQKTLGVARLAEDLSLVDKATGIIHRVFFMAALLVFLIAVFVGAMISRHVSAPISSMSVAARRFARGDLDWRLDVPGEPGNEIDELGITLNRMAAELRRAMDELAADKGKLQAILDKADDGIAVVDANARVEMLNPAASGLLGADIRQVQGKTVIEATLSHDISELVTRVLRNGAPATLEVQLRATEQAYVNVYVAPLERPDGPPGALIVMHDLTAAKRIDSIRRDFVANVSHELRTPLASIKAMAETIILRGKTDAKVAGEFAEKIMTEADRLTAISEDLLDLATIESGWRAIRRDEFRISELVGRVVSECAPRDGEMRHEVVVDMADDLVVHGDRDAIHQVLANLIDNAVRYTPPGGRVTISAGVGDGRLSIEVADTGIGIPAEDLPRIFERFYRVDRARSKASGGTGLGLSIVKHLTELMGGTVSVTSEVGKGSTVTGHPPDGLDESCLTPPPAWRSPTRLARPPVSTGTEYREE